MSSKSESGWRTIAWAGIQFQAPADWQPEKIDPSYMLLSDGSVPVLEVKWNRFKGRLSHKKQFKKLASLQERDLKKALTEINAPDEWAESLKRFDSSVFKWERYERKGTGVLLSCRECRHATLIQFFHRSKNPNKHISSRLLQSFQDHSSDGLTRWSLYDIKADVPSEYVLESFKFVPGEFQIHLKYKTSRISLYRWGPASIILKKTPMDQFASKRLNLDPQRAMADEFRSFPAIDWREAPNSRIGSAMSRLKRLPGHRNFKIWHDSETNKLLAVMHESRKRIGIDVRDQVCLSYEIE